MHPRIPHKIIKNKNKKGSIIPPIKLTNYAIPNAFSPDSSQI
jgi:hypothetical protein